MRFACAPALILACTATPLMAQTIQLECETETTESLSIGGNQPLSRVTVQMMQVTIDLGARTALFRTENPDGTPATALRNLLSATPQEVILCQADVCQRQVDEQGWNQNNSLTVIDLRTGRLSRRIEGTAPNPSGGPSNRRTIVRDGMCRRAR